jgi:hypothetical protein
MSSHSTDGFLQGAIRTLGLQFKASILCLIIFYMFATPLGCLLAFYLDFGFVGLLYGFGIGTFMQVTSYFSLIMCSDWDKIALIVSEEHKKAKAEKENSNNQEIELKTVTTIAISELDT